MALAVSGITLVSNCNSTTNWSGGALDTDFYKSPIGATPGSLKVKVSATTSSVYKYDQGTATGVDMRGYHFGIWVFIAGTVDTQANGGIRIYFEDTSGNTKTCYASGTGSTADDTYGGGWMYVVCDYEATGDATSGTYSASAHRYVGVQFKTLSKAVKENVWWDDCHYFAQLECTSGTTDGVDIDDVAKWSVSNGNGLVQEFGGAYFLATGIKWGSTAGSLHIDYSSTGKKIFFLYNKYRSSTLYTWTVQGHASTTTNYQSGTLSGTSGISGDLIVDQSTSNNFTVDVVDANTNVLKFYGGGFENTGVIDFPSIDAATHELRNTIFDTHGIIYPRSYRMKYGKSISATSDAFSISSTTFNVQYWEIVSPTDSGVWTSTDLSAGVDFQSITFVGTNGTTSYDVENTHATAVFLINMLGTTAITYKNENPGTITAELNVTLTLYVIDKDKTPIQNAQCSILKSSDDSVLMNEDTLSTGLAEESFTYSVATDIKIKVRKSETTDNPRYYAFSDTGQISASGFYLQVTLEVNPNL